MAHYYLDILKGLEIIESVHNQFGLDTLNVDKYGNMNTWIKVEGEKISEMKFSVNVKATGDDLPFDDKINERFLENYKY